MAIIHGKDGELRNINPTNDIKCKKHYDYIEVYYAYKARGTSKSASIIFKFKRVDKLEHPRSVCGIDFHRGAWLSVRNQHC